MAANLFKDTIARFVSKRVLVIGDIMLDQYSNGEVERVSPEAPVPVLKKTKEEFRLGGAANVANNLAALGARVFLAGAVGQDEAGEKIFELTAAAGIDSGAILSLAGRVTNVKHRFVSGSQQLLRLDTEDSGDLSENEQENLFKKLSVIVEKVDGVILSDYAKGVFAPALVAKILQFCNRAGKPVLADIKPGRHLTFKGVDYITPNWKEAQAMTGVNDPRQAATDLAVNFGANVFLTMGGEGIMLADKKGVVKHLPARAVKVYDVSGAGDTVAAVAFASILAGADLETAGRLANCAGEIVVQKSGTAVVSGEELLAAAATENRHIDNVKIVPKVWGYEKWLENNDRYCSKILGLNKGYQCSLHYHKNKDEMFLVLKGKVRMEVADEESVMGPGSFVRIMPGTKHRFAGLEDSEILEISTHHEEDDSYRLEESRKMD